MPRVAPNRVLVGLWLLWVGLPCIAQVGGGSIAGQIRIAPGSELKTPVIVTLQSQGIVVGSVYTDEEGRFGFNGLAPNQYFVVVNDSEYEPVREPVQIDPVTASMRMVNIYLVSRSNRDAKKTAGIAGGNKRITGSSELERQIPKSARKEFEKGTKLDREHQPDEAIRHYKKAIELAPDFYEARNNLGSALLSKSRFPEAQHEFEKVVSANPNDAAAYLNMGNLFMVTRQYEQSEHWLNLGLSKEPDSAFGNFLQGSLYTRVGRPNEAEAALRRSLELDPTMAKAHLALANLYLQQQKNTDAATELKVFVNKFPNDPLAPKAKEILQKLAP